MTNLILCGGSGTRLWPLSRSLYPKQFVPIIGKRSLFQLTMMRNRELCAHTVVVTNEKLFFIAADQAEDAVSGTASGVSFLLEGTGRNTAPAIAAACFDLDPEEIVLVSPSDHMIADSAVYAEKVAEAVQAAEKNLLVTFGIVPAHPETGYGYIEADKSSQFHNATYTVRAFREKPDSETAQRYCAAGTYYWNSGMFVFKAGVFLEELQKYSPKIHETASAAYSRRQNRQHAGYVAQYLCKEDMEAVPADSIDYAVMEQSSRGAVVVSDFGWNDLGSFDALYDVLPKDSTGNTVAEGTLTVDSADNIIMSSQRKIAVVDIHDSIIIDTEDALLVAKRGSSQKVKAVVSSLQSGDACDAVLTENHVTVHRPWGSYTVLEESSRFKIKRIVVKPGHRLSLQKHLHRSEHWVVVSGCATVQKESAEEIVRKNESTYIGIGERHRLTNNGKIPVVLIETQVGEYVGEDDIQRFDDDYARDAK